MSASNPYAALAVPIIADAAGIYHTNPRLVYWTKNSFPEEFREKWEGIYFFEERPDDDWDDLASFGYSEKIVSTPKMIEEVTENIGFPCGSEIIFEIKIGGYAYQRLGQV